ncbi:MULTISPECIES: tetratricopeptide repeat protein [unclassified Thalassospira]|uniref:tetratricopeptide repeat protein n=1 Tax=unclassified Thalassospira TaxID=2648997 RepID=UPI001FEEA0D0|nr:tetratricopeptide repeat protein [Thalassospira sp. MCCC 1A01428]
MRAKLMLLLALIGLVVALPALAQQVSEPAAGESPSQIVDLRKVTAEERSNLPPLMERYLLDEIKSLRTDMQGMRTDLMREVVNRQLEAIDKAISYSSNTVTYFFYFVAAVGALLTMLGWQSLRELKSSVRSLAHTELRRLSDEFETRLSALEEELRQKSQVINDNQREIERTQSLHAYWLQANQVTNPRSKIEIYDRMLEMSPGDPEVMAYKADAALMLGERDWALSLCNRLLAEAPESANGHYQRACANAGLGFREAALADLHRAVELSDAMRQPAWSEVEFEGLRDMPEFAEILGPRSEGDSTRPAE